MADPGAGDADLEYDTVELPVVNRLHNDYEEQIEGAQEWGNDASLLNRKASL